MKCSQLLTRKEAAAWLRRNPRWLDHAPIEWVDIRLPGASRPERAWCREAIESFLESRAVQPGHASPVE